MLNELPTPQVDDERKLENGLIVGCIVLAGLFLLACLATFLATFRQNIPGIGAYFPTATPTSTPVPHFLVHAPADNTPVLKDDFTTDQNRWSLYYDLAKAEVRDGSLTLEDFDPQSIAVANCYCQPPMDRPFSSTYYLQADLSTDKPTRALYGLIFNLTDDGFFYSFAIEQPAHRYYLKKSVPDGWVDLYSGSSTAIQPYPAVNTLSAYFDHGRIELYANGELLTTYQDQDPVNRGHIGFTVEGTDFKLMVDNLFAYSK